MDLATRGRGEVVKEVVHEVGNFGRGRGSEGDLAGCVIANDNFDMAVVPCFGRGEELVHGQAMDFTEDVAREDDCAL